MNNPDHPLVQGQEINNAPRICTYRTCKESNKWISNDCSEQIHLHRLKNQDHILNKEAFLEFATKQTRCWHSRTKSRTELLNNTVKGLVKLIGSLQKYVKVLSQDLIKMDNVKEIQHIIKIIKTDYQKLDSQQLNRIINLNNISQQNYKVKDDRMPHILNKVQDLQSNLCFKYSWNKDIPIQKKQVQSVDRNVQLKFENYLELSSQRLILTSQISNNEKYLAFGGEDCKIKILNLQKQTSKQLIQIENCVTIIKFTDDSKFLLVGDSKGIFYCYSIKRQFQQTLKYNAHTFYIYDMISIDDDRIVSCSFDESISITSIKQGKQLLLITKLHMDSINGIEFDKRNNMIISCSYDNCIKFFDGKEGKFQFQQQKAHKVYVLQIQLVSQSKNLLSSGQHDLILWQIDYEGQQLIRIKVFESAHYNFTSVLNDSRIVLVCERNIQLLDSNLDLLQSTNHNLRIAFIQQISTRQLNSLKYIVFQSGTKIQVLVRGEINK